MLIRSLAGVVGAAVVLLLAVNDVMAQSTCSSKTTTEGNGNFSVSVTQVVTDQGRRQYQYAITSPTGKQANKLFIYAHSSLANSLTASSKGGTGTFVAPHNTGGFSSLADVWKVQHHEGGAFYTSVALTQSPFVVEVPEVVQPENAKTTLVIGIGNTYEHCGPIFGPVAPPASIPGSPLVTTTAHLSFANGCSYFATVDLGNGRVTFLEPDPATPFETVGDKACTANNNADCEAETGNPFCGGNNVAQPPLQTQAGGTCYYPKNIKFTC